MPLNPEKRCSNEFARLRDFQEGQSGGGVFHCRQRAIAAGIGNARRRPWDLQRRTLCRFSVATETAGPLCKLAPVFASERNVSKSRPGRCAKLGFGSDGYRIACGSDAAWRDPGSGRSWQNWVDGNRGGTQRISERDE